MGHEAENERFGRLLGAAVIEHWDELPKEVQHALFEQAVLAGHRTERDEALREQLALFLHTKNKRTK